MLVGPCIYRDSSGVHIATSPCVPALRARPSCNRKARRDKEKPREGFGMERGAKSRAISTGGVLLRVHGFYDAAITWGQ